MRPGGIRQSGQKRLVVPKAKTMTEKTLRPEAATRAMARVALRDIFVDEGLSPRRDDLEHVWTDWLKDSIPEIGPPVALRP